MHFKEVPVADIITMIRKNPYVYTSKLAIDIESQYTLEPHSRMDFYYYLTETLERLQSDGVLFGIAGHWCLQSLDVFWHRYKYAKTPPRKDILH